jgi:hypothetical protein
MQVECLLRAAPLPPNFDSAYRAKGVKKVNPPDFSWLTDTACSKSEVPEGMSPLDPKLKSLNRALGFAYKRAQSSREIRFRDQAAGEASAKLANL